MKFIKIQNKYEKYHQPIVNEHIIDNIYKLISNNLTFNEFSYIKKEIGAITAFFVYDHISKIEFSFAIHSPITGDKICFYQSEIPSNSVRENAAFVNAVERAVDFIKG